MNNGRQRQRDVDGSARAEPASAAGDPSAVRWLNALDGVAYLTDADATILGAGGAGWWASMQSASERRALAPEALLGRNLFAQMSGDAVRAHFLALHARVLEGAQSHISFEYRCDAPDIKRTMRMSIGRLIAPDGALCVLYQSQVLSAAPRPWMSLFEPSRVLEAVRAESELPIVAMCSICERVAWPGPDGSTECWLEGEDYYARGGDPDVRVSHTICKSCSEASARQVAG